MRRPTGSRPTHRPRTRTRCIASFVTGRDPSVPGSRFRSRRRRRPKAVLESTSNSLSRRPPRWRRCLRFDRLRSSPAAVLCGTDVRPRCRGRRPAAARLADFITGDCHHVLSHAFPCVRRARLRAVVFDRLRPRRPAPHSQAACSIRSRGIPSRAPRCRLKNCAGKPCRLPTARSRSRTCPPGAYHLSVRTSGYSSRRTEVTVPSAAPMDDHGRPGTAFRGGRRPSAAMRAASSRRSSRRPCSPGRSSPSSSGCRSARRSRISQAWPSRSLGPAPARPVIRGLDGDRVLILQDGQRIGDVSSQSGDHGVPINPAAAQRIEVVRGPATLLYGANAIGGLVNVITDDIPTRPMMGAVGNVTFDARFGRQGSGRCRRRARRQRHIRASCRRRRPPYAATWRRRKATVPNSQSRSGFGNVGACRGPGPNAATSAAATATTTRSTAFRSSRAARSS